MSPLIQNLLWFAAGVVVTVAVMRLIRKQPPSPGGDTNGLITDTIPDKNDNAPIISVTQCPHGSAKDAFLINVPNLAPLFDSLNKGIKFNEAINDAIIEINNQELMEIWVKISKDHKAVLRILSMWGIRREDEIQFQPQSYHIERYDTLDGNAIVSDKTYKVVSPCWIYTRHDKNGKSKKSVIIKGQAKEI